MGDLSAIRSKRVDVAVAEFNAMRADIVSTSTAQSTFAGVGLTATGVVLGIVLQDKPNPNLAYAIPFVGALVSLIYYSYGLRMVRVGTYIRTRLWPFIANELAGHDLPNIPSWEDRLPAQRSSFKSLPHTLAFDGAMATFFLGAGIVSLDTTWGVRPVFDVLALIALPIIILAPLYALRSIRALDRTPAERSPSTVITSL